MAITLSENAARRVLEAHVTEKFTHADYQQLQTRFEALLKQAGKLNVLFVMANLHGMDAAVIWDDIKFDLKHFSDLERLAMVGDQKWEKALSVVSQAFTTAKVRFFEPAEIHEARAWVESS